MALFLVKALVKALVKVMLLLDTTQLVGEELSTPETLDNVQDYWNGR